jgi:hypothetical protein
MRKIFYLSILSLFVLSCNDEKLNLTPPASVNESLVLKTQSDFENMIRGAYSYMYRNGGESGYGSEFIIDSEVMTDNLIYSPQGRGTNLDGYRWTNTPNNTSFDYLESAYRPAELASKIISNINNINVSDARNNVEGQARFVRALCMFDMARIYSKIPTQSSDANGSLGIYYLNSFEPNAKPSRPTVAESYSNIVADLLLAKDLISNSNAVDSGLASKSAVYALLSRVYLYMGNYANVIQYGNLAISSATGTMGSILSGTQFVNLWNDVGTDGILFKIKIDAGDGVTPGTVFFQGGASARKSEFVVTKEFYNTFASNDIRKQAYIATSNYSGKSYNHVIKYDGRSSGTANVVDIKVLRIEEVYLNMAEAEFKLNGGGLTNLDKIRAKRYSNFVSGNETGTNLWNAIMKERRLELAFEMDRFFTLKRLGLDMNRSSSDGHFADGTGVPSTITNVPANDFKWQLPIPQYYRDLNSNYQQNPGY